MYNSNRNNLCNLPPNLNLNSRGPPGPPGPQGPPGISLVVRQIQESITVGVNQSTGSIGPQGPIGLTGLTGDIGTQGPIGLTGLTGFTGPIGLTGLTGDIGTQGPIGLTGPGATINFSDFYALIPGDNYVTIAIGSPILFPQNGPSNGIITRVNNRQFTLPNIGTYEINYQVSITEPGQLVIVLNGVENASSIVGRAGRTCQIIGMSLVQTSSINSILSINNPLGESTALTITPVAGGIRPVSAHLIIKQIA
jgi:hypothetical protein